LKPYTPYTLDCEKYLNRIKFTGKVTNDITGLKKLHRCHMMTVPFESLNIRFKVNIDLSIQSIYNKVVIQNRGGYCYELNYLFNSFLIELGFDTYLISSRIIKKNVCGPEFDHLSIVVKLENDWLVDVGYGDLFIEPKKILPEVIQEDQFKNYKIEHVNQNIYVLTESLKDKNDFIKKYIFTLNPCQISEFYEQNKLKQISPDSHFVKNTICTLPLNDGRKTILNNIFKVKSGERIEETKIDNTNSLLSILKEEFGISMRLNY